MRVFISLATNHLQHISNQASCFFGHIYQGCDVDKGFLALKWIFGAEMVLPKGIEIAAGKNVPQHTRGIRTHIGIVLDGKASLF